MHIFSFLSIYFFIEKKTHIFVFSYLKSIIGDKIFNENFVNFGFGVIFLNTNI